MSRDSNGNAVVNRTPAVTGQTVLAEQVNVPFADTQAMFNLVLWRDGISPMTGNQNANGFRLTNLGNPSSAQDAVTLSYIQALLDPWALQPIGAFVAYDAGESLVPPPKNNALYRYVLLTSGQTGAGLYNEGILIDESVAGTDPTISATAKVNLVNSPLNGKTIRLINSERRFLRPGVGGTLEDSALLSHTHTYSGSTSTNGSHTHPLQLAVGSGGSRNTGGAVTVGGTSFDDVAAAGDHSHTFSGTTVASGGSEARPRSIGVVYYRRIL